MKECPNCEYAMAREVELIDENDITKGYCFKWTCLECGHEFYTYPLDPAK